MRLQAANSTTTMYYSVTNAVPAKPYLPIASGANTYYLPLTTATLAGVKLKVQSGNATYRACIYQSGYYNTTSAAVGNLSSTTALTSASTSAYSYKSSASTSAYSYKTSASTSGYSYKSSASTSGYSYKTSASTVNYTVTALTKVTTNINGTIFQTSANNFSIHQYWIATYFQNAWAGYHVSGNVILERDFAWNNGGYKTTAGNNFDKASYKFTNVNAYPTYQLESTNGRPKMWLWQANTTNTANTKSTITDIGWMPYGNTMWTWYGASASGTSVSRAFSWTTFWFTNLATSSNQTVQTGGITSASVVMFNNIFSTADTMTRSFNIINLFRSSYAAWMTLTMTRVHHIQYREARVRETVNTSSTKPVTSSTVPLTKPVTYSTVPLTKPVTSSTIPLTKPVTYSTIPLTKPVTYGYSGKLSSSKWA